MRILLKDLGLTLPQHLRHSLIRYAARTEARDRAVDWALTDKGKERDWFWRYKFHFDRAVQFRPELYGCSWIEGSVQLGDPDGSHDGGAQTVCLL